LLFFQAGQIYKKSTRKIASRQIFFY